MVHKKKKSKRLTLKEQWKIKKRVQQHNKKKRREARKNPHKRTKLRKDPGVPNLYPFKEKFIAKMERMQEEKDAEEQQRKEAKAKRKRTRKAVSMQQMVENARRRQQEHEDFVQRKEEEKEKGVEKSLGANTRRAFFKEFGKIVGAADVILEVLDARDPLGCRCKKIEEFILQKDPNKKIILVLNKIDLIPKSNIQQWLQYLRGEYPTIAFKSSTQEQKSNLSRRNNSKFQSMPKADQKVSFTAECFGADSLLNILKNYCRNSNIKTSITVGVIGYPNVGKSSLINSLYRSKAMKTGGIPGVTREIKQIKLDKNISLIDSPGIVFSADTKNTDLILRNQVKIDQSLNKVDYHALISTIVNKCSTGRLMEIYKLPYFSGADAFLSAVAKNYGKLRRGGVPDLPAAAVIVLRDWYNGKIPFYSIPPERVTVHLGAEVVTSWGKEFNLDDVQSVATVMEELPMSSAKESEWISLGESKVADDDRRLMLELEKLSFGGSSAATTTSNSPKKRGRPQDSELNEQRNRDTKKAQKKQRKLTKREQKKTLMSELSEFDFSVDFIPDVNLKTANTSTGDEEEREETPIDDGDTELFDVDGMI